MSNPSSPGIQVYVTPFQDGFEDIFVAFTLYRCKNTCSRSLVPGRCRAGGSIQNELELINSNPMQEMERELELKDLEQNELNWN